MHTHIYYTYIYLCKNWEIYGHYNCNSVIIHVLYWEAVTLFDVFLNFSWMELQWSGDLYLQYMQQSNQDLYLSLQVARMVVPFW